MVKLVYTTDLKSVASAYRFDSDHGYQRIIMAKVYVDRDSCPGFFLWDKQVLDIIDADDYLIKVEVPDTLILEYTDVMERYGKMQEKLRKYYDETQRTREALARS